MYNLRHSENNANGDVLLCLWMRTVIGRCTCVCGGGVMLLEFSNTEQEFARCPRGGRACQANASACPKTWRCEIDWHVWETAKRLLRLNHRELGRVGRRDSQGREQSDCQEPFMLIKEWSFGFIFLRGGKVSERC